jgi:hypothetical protein
MNMPLFLSIGSVIAEFLAQVISLLEYARQENPQLRYITGPMC